MPDGREIDYELGSHKDNDVIFIYF